MAVRLFFLLLAALAVLAALGLLAADVPAPAARLWVATVFAVLAPLFWPGAAPGAETGAHGVAGSTALRVLTWSGAVAGLVAAVVLLTGRAGPSAADAGLLCLLLGAVLVLVHALGLWPCR